MTALNSAPPNSSGNVVFAIVTSTIVGAMANGLAGAFWGVLAAVALATVDALIRQQPPEIAMEAWLSTFSCRRCDARFTPCRENDWRRPGDLS
jgi:hypothetical protein